MHREISFQNLNRHLQKGRDKKVCVKRILETPEFSKHAHYLTSCVKQSASIVEKIASAMFRSLTIFYKHSLISSPIRTLNLPQVCSKQALSDRRDVGTGTRPMKFKRSYLKLMRRPSSSDKPPLAIYCDHLTPLT